jgi:hypothetical protein
VDTPNCGQTPQITCGRPKLARGTPQRRNRHRQRRNNRRKTLRNPNTSHPATIIPNDDRRNVVKHPPRRPDPTQNQRLDRPPNSASDWLRPPALTTDSPRRPRPTHAWPDYPRLVPIAPHLPKSAPTLTNRISGHPPFAPCAGAAGWRRSDLDTLQTVRSLPQEDPRLTVPRV